MRVAIAGAGAVGRSIARELIRHLESHIVARHGILITYVAETGDEALMTEDAGSEPREREPGEAGDSVDWPAPDTVTAPPDPPPENPSGIPCVKWCCVRR